MSKKSKLAFYLLISAYVILQLSVLEVSVYVELLIDAIVIVNFFAILTDED